MYILFTCIGGDGGGVDARHGFTAALGAQWRQDGRQAGPRRRSSAGLGRELVGRQRALRTDAERVLGVGSATCRRSLQPRHEEAPLGLEQPPGLEVVGARGAEAASGLGRATPPRRQQAAVGQVRVVGGGRVPALRDGGRRGATLGGARRPEVVLGVAVDDCGRAGAPRTALLLLLLLTARLRPRCRRRPLLLLVDPA